MAAESESRDWITKAAAVVRNGYLGGELQAAIRQGFNELGAALKAFPDAIQVDEPGAAWNPLYRDIPGNSRPTVHGGPEPMKDGVSMKDGQPTRQGQQPDNATGQAQANHIDRIPSITEAILSDPAKFQPHDQQRQNGLEQQQPGQQQEQEHGRGM